MSKKNRKEDKSIIVPQRDKVQQAFEIKEFPWTPRQKEVIDLILNKETKIVFLKAPAGAAKTLLSVFCGLKLLTEKKVSDITYVRSIIESASKGLGSLPGTIEEKFDPFLMPLEDKLEELIKTSDIQKLKSDSRIQAIPINFLRGSTFNARYIIADETQNFSLKEIITLITRLGRFSKMILCGDTMQSDLMGKSGFQPIIDIFNDEESRKQGIHVVTLGKEDIMRSEILKFIVEKLESRDKKAD